MDRLALIQLLMKKKKLRNYLEIGVFNGHIFFRIKSDFKIAVDPEFRFDALRKAGKILLNPTNLYNRYYRKPSDDFFREDAPALFSKNPINISLIDGMHEYDYALRDIENTVKYLSPNGVIIVHDCNPLTAESACSFAEWKERDFRGTWNGDVWKAILHIRSLRKDLNAFVLDTDHGLGVIVKKPANRAPDLQTGPIPDFSPQEIKELSFAEFDRHRKEWLDLRPEDYLYEFFGI